MKIYLAINKLEVSRDISYSIKIVAEQFGHSIVTLDGFTYDINDKNVTLNDLIKGSDLVIADISSSDPTVMYQAGVAKTLNIPLIIISQNFELPLDLEGYRFIKYDRSKLKASLVNPLSIIFSQKDLGSKIKKIVSSEIKNRKIKKTVFVSYSHKDIGYLERLIIHLKPFERRGLIDLWSDTKIKAGEKWEEKIKNALNKCVIAILMISADFLASDFIVDNELPPLLKDAEKKGKKIIPVILKPCRFTSDSNLSKFQSINDPNTPLSKLRGNKREELYVKIADHIENELKLTS